ncbi:MAG: tetratricopeptide repeat protein [Deltaproteobacteria bacterium]|nr:tetratricopeptide repeat protein [Deltaproteobacteria bacterium]
MVDETNQGPDMSDDDWDADLDDDFLFHLVQGGDLMRSGRMVEAKEHLEKAVSLKPENARGQNMLGLVYFKLGLYQRAIDIGRSLIERYPEDVTLHVNLAMIHLKIGQLEQAEQVLHGALALEAEHVNAHRYLGLVLARLGRTELAREHFQRAGVQNVEHLLEEGRIAAEGDSESDSGSLVMEAEGYEDFESLQTAALIPDPQIPDQGEPRQMGVTESTFLDHGPVEMGSDPGPTDDDEPAQMASIPPLPADSQEKALEELYMPDEVGEAEGAGFQGPDLDHEKEEVIPLGDGLEHYMEETVTMPGAPQGADARVGFAPEGGTLRIVVEDQVFLRASELKWIRGDLNFKAVNKRFAGKETRHPFERGEQAMMLAEGQGQISMVTQKDRELFMLEYDGGPLYLVEQNVFAFSFTEAWENGRLPAIKGADLAIFHLFAPAQVVLSLPCAFRRFALKEGERIRLHVRELVGWAGELVPKLLEPEHPLPGALWIELTGQGEVWCLE